MKYAVALIAAQVKETTRTVGTNFVVETYLVEAANDFEAGGMASVILDARFPVSAGWQHRTFRYGSQIVNASKPINPAEMPKCL